MSRKDARTLRDDAQAAAATGKHKRALEAYVELERLEASDPQWPKRAGDMLRKLGKDREAIAAYDRAVDRYAQSGFVVQAIAMCRLILQIDPQHGETARRLADMTEQQESGRTRIGALAAQQAQVTDGDLVAAQARGRRPSRPAPAAAAATDALELEPTSAAGPLPVAARRLPRATPAHAAAARDVIAELSLDPDAGELELEPTSAVSSAGPVDRARRDSAIPLDAADLESVPAAPRIPARAVAPPRANRASAPIPLAPGAPLDTVRLGRIAPGALEQKLPDGSLTGIVMIPLDDELLELEPDPDELEPDPGDAEPPELIDLEPDPEVPAERADSAAAALASDADAEVFAELARPRAWSNAARKALAATPLFSALDHDTLEAMLTRIGLVSLEPAEVLFREGEPGDTLYIVVEGEVGVAREGPPRRPLARLGPGSFFGEVALITDQARTATVEAISATQLLTIDRALVSTLVAEHPDVLFVILRFVRDRLLARLLDTSPLFAPMAPADRGALAARFRFLEIEAGSAIVEPGAKPAGLYVFLAGRADARRGRELMRYLGAGDLAGETAVLHGAPSTVRIAAITRCLALCLPANEFREVIMTHPHVLEYVGELAARDETAGGPPAFRLDLV